MEYVFVRLPKKKIFLLKLWQKFQYLIVLQRPVTFSHQVVVNFTNKQVIILETGSSEVCKDYFEIYKALIFVQKWQHLSFCHRGFDFQISIFKNKKWDAIRLRWFWTSNLCFLVKKIRFARWPDMLSQTIYYWQEIFLLTLCLCAYVYIYSIHNWGFLEVAIESWPEWDLNPWPLNSIQML